MSHLRPSPPRRGPPDPSSRSQGNLQSAATISKDATHGRAGEERQILSNLAQRAQASNAFGVRSDDPTPAVDPGFLAPPPSLDLPPPDLMSRPPPAGSGYNSEETDDEDDDDKSLFDLARSSSIVSGKRPMATSTSAKVPLDWQPRWSSSSDTEFVAVTNEDEKTAISIATPEIKRREGKKPSSEVDGELSPEPRSSSVSGLTETLAGVIQKQLKHNLLGPGPDSTMFKFLLDNIERLEWINIALNDKLEKLGNPEKPISPTTKEQADAPVVAELSATDGTSARITGVQVLHNVVCGNFRHDHDGVYFADQPIYREGQSRRSKQPTKKLEGTIVINDVEAYIRCNPELSFVVFKSHVCEDQRFRYVRPPFNLMCACRVCVENELLQQRNVGEMQSEQLRVVSPELKRALRSLGDCRIDGHVTGTEDDPQMSAPYLYLYHHRAQLNRKLREEKTSETEHLQRLKDWLDENYGNQYDEADQLFADGLVSQSHISKLFKPNQVIIKQKPGRDAKAYVVQYWPFLKGEELYTQVWSWEYDGFELRRKRKLLSLTFHSQENMRVTDLKVFPLEYAPQSLVDSVIKRGQKYWSMRNGKFVSYSGLDSLREESYQNNRFMIDIKTHIRIHPNKDGKTYWVPPAGCVAYDAKEFDPYPRQISSSGSLKDQLAMLLPSQIPGFEMESKKWVNLNIMQTEDVTWNQKAFGRLVLDEPSKDLIRALVSVHLGNKITGDIIAGKGNGLIILLHGSPGVGKTLTAESVAELAEKPLYRVTCGDIGNKPDEVEKYLRTVLYLGKIWDCVLLMDEADVFLEERTMADLQRNSLVSVFLRVLESYDGILILTSNRVGSFDEAFKSRIQVALHYKPLNRQSRKQIWQNFFEMIEEENSDVDVGEFESRLDELAKEEMNGRQIRNCLQTAQQLSKFKEEPLSWSSLSQTIKTAANFQRYLKEIQGHNDEQWAREEHLR
ncbi:unnamed protein product [Periconia digitata]|uniref:AAA+ ATPase domain-containing protein n=1 Tax=Periconia digitata TaxID=1303443 RepID=A0A9W4U323_9PLEO|nr:unnamed protein product [Periconia digitata]